MSSIAASQDLALAPVVSLFLLAGVVAQSCKVSLPTARPGHRLDQTLGSAVIVASILVLPTHWAVLVGAAATAFARGGRRAWFDRCFNTCQLTLSTAGSGAVWHLAGPAPRAGDVAAVQWIALALPVYLVLDAFWNSGLVALASGLPVWLVCWRSYRNIWPATVSIALLGVLVAVLWTTSPWAIALVSIPLCALYYTVRNTVSLETQTREALFDLADILDARDPYTHGHSLRVGEYAEKLALAIGLSGEDAHLIYLAGRLHDIGKCAVRNEVLLKPAALDEEERAHMCIHPEVGSSMLHAFSLFGQCAAFVRGHHERWDGTGYPDRLRGDAIPLGARVIAVADAYDAMTTTRPYRTALPREEAFRRLRKGAGAQWDARMVEAFLALMGAEPLAAEPPTELAVSASARTTAA